MPHLFSSTDVGNHEQEIPAKRTSQCNQSSPPIKITRTIGHLQTTIKPNKLSFWLLFATAPNNRINKMPSLLIRTAQALPATKTIRSWQKYFVFYSSITNKYWQHDAVGRTTIQSWICRPSRILQSIRRFLP